ncbi:hypothetical protein TSUD_148040 [Trifolium subterraneum]|uniref:Uncharacterized protein n=2 Tax=Trifolium subterraneum TaxID=3900 RepID=A0A2Z6NPS3_TRISU|nr:hypothetical protein TSUD_148040 [Trifolium subterraneum]
MAKNAKFISEGGSSNRPPLFDGDNYYYWKDKMELFLRSQDNNMWHVLEVGEYVPLAKDSTNPKPQAEWTTTEADTKEIWETLQTHHEGTNCIKETRIDIGVRKFELFEMKEEKTIDQMYGRFTSIINELNSLGKTYTTHERIRKILRCLSKTWRPIVTAITVAKDLTKVSLEDLIGSLKAHESVLQEDKPKRKMIALETQSGECSQKDETLCEDEESLQEDDEEELAFLSRRIQRLLTRRNQLKKNFQPKRNGAKPEECLLAVKKRPWYLDSGCSRHMTGDRNSFLSFETREGGSVTFGNNEKASIKDELPPESCFVSLEKDKWIWHKRADHVSMKTMSKLSKLDLVRGFPKISFDLDKMSMMGELGFFLGLQIKQQEDEIFISQEKYVNDFLKKYKMNEAKIMSNPMHPSTSLDKDEKGKDVYEKEYRGMIGSLLYLTASRPDIVFAVGLCARFQTSPKESHLIAVKRIFRYLVGTPDVGLWYKKGSHFDLQAYCDADYAGDKIERKSTSGACQFLGEALVSWCCRKQNTIALSTTEAEYVAASNCCSQVIWIKNQLEDFSLRNPSRLIPPKLEGHQELCLGAGKKPVVDTTVHVLDQSDSEIDLLDKEIDDFELEPVTSTKSEPVKPKKSPTPKKKEVETAVKAPRTKKKVNLKKLKAKLLPAPLIQPEDEEIFDKYWKTKPVAVSRLYNFAELSIGGVDLVKFVEPFEWKSFFHIKETVYPLLVQAFYFNAQVFPDKDLITSNIKDVELVVDPYVIGSLIGIKSEGLEVYGNDWYDQVKISKEELKKKMFTEEGAKKNSPPSSMLKTEYKLLHNMCQHSFFPPTGSKDKVTDLDLLMMYHMAKGVKLNLPYIILHHMIHAATSGFKKIALPYAMLLTRVFRLYYADMDNTPSENHYYTFSLKNVSHMKKEIEPPVADVGVKRKREIFEKSSLNVLADASGDRLKNDLQTDGNAQTTTSEKLVTTAAATLQGFKPMPVPPHTTMFSPLMTSSQGSLSSFCTSEFIRNILTSDTPDISTMSIPNPNDSTLPSIPSSFATFDSFCSSVNATNAGTQKLVFEENANFDFPGPSRPTKRFKLETDMEQMRKDLDIVIKGMAVQHSMMNHLILESKTLRTWFTTVVCPQLHIPPPPEIETPQFDSFPDTNDKSDDDDCPTTSPAPDGATE